MTNSADPVLDADWHMTQLDMTRDRAERTRYCRECAHCVVSDVETIGWCRDAQEFCDPTLLIADGCLNDWEVYE